jgi:hypothetical protein
MDGQRLVPPPRTHVTYGSPKWHPGPWRQINYPQIGTGRLCHPCPKLLRAPRPDRKPRAKAARTRPRATSPTPPKLAITTAPLESFGPPPPIPLARARAIKTRALRQGIDLSV